MNPSARRRLTIIFLLLPAILVISFNQIYPIIFSIGLSFTNYDVITQNSEFIGLTNYIKVLQLPEFYPTIMRTIIYATSVTLFTFLIGMGLALLFNQPIKGKNVFSGIFLCPYLIPTVVTAYNFIWLFDVDFGVVPFVLTRLHLISGPFPPVRGTQSLALLTTIFVSIWRFIPFMATSLLARLQIISKDMYEAAKLDGSSALQRFWYITLPQLKGTIFLLFLIRFIFMFNHFDLIYLTTRGGPLQASTTLPILTYYTAFNSLKIAEAATMATLSFLLLLLISLPYFRLYKIKV